jgi:hypothetical protein
MKYKPIIRNRLDKVFKTTASEGVFLCILLLIILLSYLAFLIEKCENGYYHDLLEALFLNTSFLAMAIWIFFFIFSAYLGFATTYINIDTANKRVKYDTKLFCIILKGGKWKCLTSDMKLGFLKTQKKYRVYNYLRTYGVVPYNDLKIVLYNTKNKEILPVKKIKREKNAENELKKLSELLELGIKERKSFEEKYQPLTWRFGATAAK